jgi:hypothetical protein
MDAGSGPAPSTVAEHELHRDAMSSRLGMVASSGDVVRQIPVLQKSTKRIPKTGKPQG